MKHKTEVLGLNIKNNVTKYSPDGSLYTIPTVHALVCKCEEFYVIIEMYLDKGMLSNTERGVHACMVETYGYEYEYHLEYKAKYPIYIDLPDVGENTHNIVFSISNPQYNDMYAGYYYINMDLFEKTSDTHSDDYVPAPTAVDVDDKKESANHPSEDNDIRKVFDSINNMVQAKNKKYGGSALKPLEIFAKHHGYGSRIDEKLARVKNSEELSQNDVGDIIGGLVLICKDKGWFDFEKFID